MEISGESRSFVVSLQRICMKLTLEIQEEKLSFFLELIRNFNFVRVDTADKLTLTQEHLDILEERLAAYEAAPDDVITWEEVRSAVKST